MLLALRSLWEQSEANVTVFGEGVAANPAIGSGLVVTERGIYGGKRRRLRNWHEIVSPMMRPPMPEDVIVNGVGVAAQPRIGNGTFRIEVDFSDDELIG